MSYLNIQLGQFHPRPAAAVPGKGRPNIVLGHFRQIWVGSHLDHRHGLTTPLGGLKPMQGQLRTKQTWG